MGNTTQRAKRARRHFTDADRQQIHAELDRILGLVSFEAAYAELDARHWPGVLRGRLAHGR